MTSRATSCVVSSWEGEGRESWNLQHKEELGEWEKEQRFLGML